jgi:predicted Zn finger-like uncharacterized protein
MDVRCEKCRTEYVLDDTRVTEAGVPVRCTSCQYVFLVRKRIVVVTEALSQDAASKAEPASGMAPPEKREWKVRQASGNLFTCKELTTLQKWIVERKVTRDDEISLTGESWKRLGNIAELASFFQVVDEAQRALQLSALQPVQQPHDPFGLGPEIRDAPGSVPVLSPVGLSAPSGFPIVFADEAPAGPRRRPRSAAGPFLSGLLLVGLGAGGFYAFTVHGPLRANASAPVRERTSGERPFAPPATALPTDGDSTLTAGLGEVRNASIKTPTAKTPAGKTPPKAAPAAPAPKEKTFEQWLEHAEKLRQKDQLTAAMTAYGKATDLEPDRPEPYSGRGLVLLDQENPVQAEVAFDQALKLNPRYGEALLGLAETYRLQGREEDAIQFYRKYLEVLPDGPEAKVAKEAIRRLSK